MREAGRPKPYYLVHGEEEAASALAASLSDAGTADVIVPQRVEGFVLD